MTGTYKVGKIYFDKTRTQTGIILVCLGLPIVFTCMYLSIEGMEILGLYKISADSLNVNDKASVFAIFLIFPFGFGFMSAQEITYKIMNVIEKRSGVRP